MRSSTGSSLRLLRKLEVVLEARKFLVGETEDALTAATEFFVRGRVLGLERSILSSPYPWRSTRCTWPRRVFEHLEHKKWRLAARLRVDGELPLVGGVELDLEQLGYAARVSKVPSLRGCTNLSKPCSQASPAAVKLQNA